MIIEDLFRQIRENIKSVFIEGDPLGDSLYNEFIKLHPADIAKFLTVIDGKSFKKLFKRLSETLQNKVFRYLQDYLRLDLLNSLGDEEKIRLLHVLDSDELTDFFEFLSDHDLKKYLKLLNKKTIDRVIANMKFSPDSAGGIMDTDVITFKEDSTVGECINILRRANLDIDLYRYLYVVNNNGSLLGNIQLEDLILQKPETKLSEFLRKNILVINVNEDKEDIVKKMTHYDITMSPVVNTDNRFLGVIPSNTLVEVIGQEASEDVYKISAMSPIKESYFGTSFFKILYERSYILVALLLFQSISSMIIERYHSLLDGFLMIFITMLVSTGGNSSSQTSAVVIQGMASGEITKDNVNRFLTREFFTAVYLSIILGIVGFLRAYWTTRLLLGSFAVSLSLSLIVLVSIVLGSVLPVILKRLKFDPANSAGPFLATLMDILGLFIYCYVSNWILG